MGEQFADEKALEIAKAIVTERQGTTEESGGAGPYADGPARINNDQPERIRKIKSERRIE
jgi:hypothetical protein